MRLDELLEEAKKAMPITVKVSDKHASVEGITDNTEKVKEGYIFVCVKGKKFDGHSAAKEMLKKGAVCVVTEQDLGLDEQIVVSDSRVFYGHLCAIWFNHPEKRMNLIGVTGTNGKTTIATMIKDMFTSRGHRVGFIGTTGILIHGRPVDTDGSTPTTPRVYDLYRIFYEMAKNGCDTVVMEVSSFALAQNRIGPARFRVAIFTNLTEDHLDYHADMDSYYEAKKKLFTDHCETAIINIDDKYGLKLYDELKDSGVERISCSISGQPADVMGNTIKQGGTATKFWIAIQKKNYPFNMNMMGAYNVLNAIQAVAACLKLNLGINAAVHALAAFKGVRGRCEIIPVKADFTVICDYAHSPDALEQMLNNIKEYCKGRLICLFGCGGDRDKTKRPLMAKAAEKHSDLMVITSDNPRNEDPEAIIDDIIEGLSFITPYMRITDRKAAIRRAITIAEKGDIIVLAGKGHEDYQILKDNVHIHFDEREIVKDVMKTYSRRRYDPKKSESISINEIVETVGGNPQNIRNFDRQIPMASFFSDTRDPVSGGIFVALKGANFDGHDFVHKAISSGAVLAITERNITDSPCIVVRNTRKALLDLSRHFRSKLASVVVGITGSVGKTTTKEMAALALASGHSVFKSEGNHNNEIGLPFSVFKMNKTCSAAVLEMGMSDYGEIERLSRACKPNICVITNIGFSHIENLGSQEGILEAKLEILKGADKNAPLIVNSDDPLLARVKDEYEGYRKVITYAIDDPEADFRAVEIKTFSDRMYFSVCQNGEMVCDVDLFCIGQHNIYNAVAAIAIAVTAGCDPIIAAEMLSGFQPDSLRQNIQKMGAQTVIVDCYNAAPTSMKAAIDVLCEMKPAGNGRRVAVLGDMLELGEQSKELHREIGEYIVKKGVDMLVCYGKDSKYTAERAEELGMHAGSSEDKKIVLNFMKYKLKPDDIVLFKASRGMHLEELIDEFYKNK
ncbi:MAG: UDP-N-acetylmuramoyl-L-alanyl-D-glutamate--2,6-diaminopimelate ligase [Oscillospiraceae bacterium]|nr:UDP-N-acetylmuramoyl-L-alanyl-D-glutamate--2,6-diaminopimelate ligase [Oscillospiraceae bacterium]